MAEEQKIYITGCGCGTSISLTKEAVDSINEAQLLIGTPWLLEALASPEVKTVPVHTAEQMYEAVTSADVPVITVLIPGDPAFSAAAQFLEMQLDHEPVFICGVSRVSVLCSRTGIPEEKVRFLQPKTEKTRLSYAVSRSRYACIQPDGEISAADILTSLAADELGGIEVYLGSCLGQEREVIRHGPVNELKEAVYPEDTVLLFSNPDWSHYTMIGLPDESFFRGTVPMTKFEVRNIASSKLEVCATDIIYDVGGGTGSVSIELARRAYDGKVYAVERLPEALYLLNKNRRHLRAFNMEIVAGEAPEAFAQLPPPDKVFIGGSGGRIDAIIGSVLSLNPRALICATAATLETLAAARQAFSAHRCHAEVIQVSAARLVPRGNAFSMFEAINPVFVLVGRP